MSDDNVNGEHDTVDEDQETTAAPGSGPGAPPSLDEDSAVEPGSGPGAPNP